MRTVRQYIARRLVLMTASLVIVSLVVFSLVRLIPGDVALLMLSQGDYTIGDVDRLREALGLNRPFHVQYFVWVSGLLHLDLGDSLWTGRPVVDEIVVRIPVTAELAVLAISVSLLIGIPAGVLSAVRQDTLLDYVVRGLAIGGLSVPNFILGTLLVLSLSTFLEWLPPITYVSFVVNPWTNIQQFVFPSAVLGIGLSATTMRFVRAMMLEVLRQDFIRTALSKGLSERAVIYRHGLKNALVPVVSNIGIQISILLGGTIIVEAIFNLPGVGKLVWQSVIWRDYPLIQGLNLLMAGTVILLNLLIDISYAFLDPRIRYA